MTPRLPPPDSESHRAPRDPRRRRHRAHAAAHGAGDRRAHPARTARPLYLVGVRTGGAFLAQRLVALMAEAGRSEAAPAGAVDISLYRDDVFRGLPKPEIGPTELPEPIDGQTVVLVDDVLYTGRTIRAAMDVLADYGRPRAVQLAALVDRGRRELPIQPDFVGVARADHRARVGARDAGRAGRGRPGRPAGAARVSRLRATATCWASSRLSAAEIAHAARSRRALPGDQRAAHQEGADAARQDGHQPLPRAVDAHAHLVRDRRQAAVGRRGQHLGRRPRRRSRARRCSTPPATSTRWRPTWWCCATRRRARPRCWRGGCVAARVVNAGDGAHEHPTQALLDCSTIRAHKGRSRGSTVAICGDIRHSRVARSNIWALTELGAQVRVAGAAHAAARPASRSMGRRHRHRPRAHRAGARGRRRGHDAAHPEGAHRHGPLPQHARVLALLRPQRPRRLALAKPDAIVMHPGPINRGVEIDPSVADGPRAVILDQVSRGVAVRMAVLYLLAGGDGGPSE